MAERVTGAFAPKFPAETGVLDPGRFSRTICAITVLFIAIAPSWAEGPAEPAEPPSATNSEVVLPDTPSVAKKAQHKSFTQSLGTAVKTIGEDELHIIKSPFSVNALKWDALVVGATGILIANDESVAHQVSPSWHNTSINISDAGVYGLGAAAGGIFVTGLITHNEHAIDAGIRTAEASVDSVILYAALKAVLARQRPYTGQGEGRFFSGNWSSGSFPSGHAAFAWTLASVMAHEYPNWPVRLLAYGVATAVSTTRVTGGVHFPADVFSGSVIGYGVGTYVAHKDRQQQPSSHPHNKIKRLPDAILKHVAIP